MEQDLTSKIILIHIDKIIELDQKLRDSEKTLKSAIDKLAEYSLKIRDLEDELTKNEIELNKKTESMDALSSSFTDLKIANQNLRMGGN